MILRRPLLLVCAAALAATLSSCGYDDYATDRVYTPAAGPIARDGVVDVLSAVVVSQRDGLGTFVGGLSNTSGSETITFTDLAPAGNQLLEVEEFEPRAIVPQGYENLATPGNGIGVSGEFAAGDFVTVELSFDNGEVAELDIPVVTDCGMWDGLDTNGIAAAATGEVEGEAYECEPLEPAHEWGPDAEH